MFEFLRGICDYNESYFARRAMLIELRSAILSNKFTEYTGKIVGAAFLIKKRLIIINLNNYDTYL